MSVVSGRVLAAFRVRARLAILASLRPYSVGKYLPNLNLKFWMTPKGSRREAVATRKPPRGSRHEEADTRQPPRGSHHEEAAAWQPPRGCRWVGEYLPAPVLFCKQMCSGKCVEPRKTAPACGWSMCHPRGPASTLEPETAAATLFLSARCCTARPSCKYWLEMLHGRCWISDAGTHVPVRNFC